MTCDPFFQLNEYEFRVPGLERTYTFLHISDVHISAPDYETDPEEKAKLEKSVSNWESGRISFAKAFHESCAPEHLIPLNGYFDRWVEFANELNPDALLCTGDLFDFYAEADVRYLRDALSKLKPDFLWVPGNHEVDDRPAFREFMGEDRSLQIRRYGKLKLLGLNDAAKTVTAAQTARLREEAEDGCYPILLAHIPLRTAANDRALESIGAYYSIHQGESDSETEAFLAYLTAPECPIREVFCGHIHGAQVTTLAEGKVQITASAAMIGGGNLLRFIPA